jgi:hypothetical protein
MRADLNIVRAKNCRQALGTKLLVETFVGHYNIKGDIGESLWSRPRHF